jgi:2-polyprenyl-3-methyl-5-hydroxy-6-metoxy-1,4-benzoquinol methylase
LPVFEVLILKWKKVKVDFKMIENNLPNCLICDDPMQIELYGLFDNRFGSRGEYFILVCKHCGFLITAPVPEYQELIDLYETHYNFPKNGENIYTNLRRFFLNSIAYKFWTTLDGDISFHMIRGRGWLLDIGCNEGRGLQIYERNGYTAEGLELNETAAAEARKAGFRIYDDLLEQFEPEKLYDVVVLSNVIEHSLDPKDMLNHVNRILEAGGQVWISCPNVDSWQRKLFGKYWINWHVPFHIVHFSQKTLINILKETGFEIQAIRQESPALWLAHSIIVRLFAQFGQPTKQLRNPFLVAPLLILIRFLFFPLLWLGNSLGHGDCLVVVAQKVPK